jgi:hypothetical protein
MAAHNPEVEGSNPSPATKLTRDLAPHLLSGVGGVARFGSDILLGFLQLACTLICLDQFDAQALRRTVGAACGKRAAEPAALALAGH